MKRSALLGAAALGAALIPFAPAGAQDTGTVYIAHGIDVGGGLGGFPVTVCVNNDIIDDDFRTGEVIGPVELPAGTYEAEVFAGTVANCDGTPAIAASIPVTAGTNATAMAYWAVGAEQGPSLALLPNPVDCTEAGEGRVVARHAAGAPPVDVLADGSPLFTGLANGEQDSADVPAGTYSVDVIVPPDTPVLEDIPLTVTEGQVSIAYVIGNVDGPPTAFVQEIPVEECPAPTTTTTTTTTLVTTTTAAPIRPATVTPTFTG